MQCRLKQNALVSNYKACPNNAFLASSSVQMLYPTSILIFRLKANEKNQNETIHETKKELGFTVVGSVSSVSLSPRTSCHSDCVKQKATFLNLCTSGREAHPRQFQPSPQAVNRKLLIDPTGWEESEKENPLKEKDRIFFIAENTHVISIPLSTPVQVLSLAFIGKPSWKNICNQTTGILDTVTPKF